MNLTGISARRLCATERFARDYIKALAFGPVTELLREYDRRAERIKELEAQIAAKHTDEES